MKKESVASCNGKGKDERSKKVRTVRFIAAYDKGNVDVNLSVTAGAENRSVV